MWTRGVDIPELDCYIEEMRGYGFEMWSQAGREIEARFAADGSPVRALEGLEPPCSTLHVYAQPRQEEYLAAQQSYAADHPWFAVHRLAAASHFPMFEVPSDLADVLERFVLELH